MEDFFSASWLMSKRRFLEIKTYNIQTVESACFVPLRQYRDDIRMTTDWLEFCVEHMSKWWKVLNITDSNSLFEFFIDQLNSFIDKCEKEDYCTILKDTIAIIPMLPYEPLSHIQEKPSLTITVLKATIASLARYGIGRIVIVAPEDVTNVCRHFFQENYQNTSIDFKSYNNLKTKYIQKNMPYGAIRGLQEAFKCDHDNWLNNKTDWKGIYLTEPDTFLHAKPNKLHAIVGNVIEQDMVFSPHRLQPIPHESDIGKFQKNSIFFPMSKEFKVEDISSYDMNCYDGGNIRSEGGKGTNPINNPNRRDKFWYMQGFDNADFSHLDDYRFMRLSNGCGITMLMGNEHGRKCILQKK